MTSLWTTPRTAQRTRAALRGCPQGLGQPPHRSTLQPHRGLPTFPQALTTDHSIKRTPTQGNSQAIRQTRLSLLRQCHGWTLAGYREAFRLPVKVATCSRELRVLHSAHARSEIERGSGFGSGVGVPVSLRPAVGCRDGARWRLAQSSRARFIPSATPWSMICRRSRPRRAAVECPGFDGDRVCRSL